MTEERPSQLAAVRTKGGASHPRIAVLKVRGLSRGGGGAEGLASANSSWRWCHEMRAALRAGGAQLGPHRPS